MNFAEVTKTSEARVILADRLEKAFKNSPKYGDKSIQELSEVTGISASYLAAIFRGEKTPSLKYLFTIVHILEVDLQHIILGLERFIKPRGYIVKGDTQDEIERYLLSMQNEVGEFYNDFEETGTKSGTKGGAIIEQASTLVVYDKSMEALGFRKHSIVKWKEIDEEPVPGKVYIVKLSSKLLIRRIWFEGDNIVLIPCANTMYDIISAHREDAQVVGIPLSVFYQINL